MYARQTEGQFYTRAGQSILRLWIGFVLVTSMHAPLLQIRLDLTARVRAISIFDCVQNQTHVPEVFLFSFTVSAAARTPLISGPFVILVACPIRRGFHLRVKRGYTFSRALSTPTDRVDTVRLLNANFPNDRDARESRQSVLREETYLASDEHWTSCSPHTLPEHLYRFPSLHCSVPCVQFSAEVLDTITS